MSRTYPKLANLNQWLLSQLMMLKSVDLMMSSLLQRLLTLPRTLKNFSRIIIERKEVRPLLKIRNFRKNDPIKVNNNEKPREKVGQSSNNSISPQCFGCQGMVT